MTDGPTTGELGQGGLRSTGVSPVGDGSHRWSLLSVGCWTRSLPRTWGLPPSWEEPGACTVGPQVHREGGRGGTRTGVQGAGGSGGYGRRADPGPSGRVSPGGVGRMVRRVWGPESDVFLPFVSDSSLIPTSPGCDRRPAPVPATPVEDGRPWVGTLD